MSFPAPFATTGITEYQKNADLAIYLLNYLEQTCDPYDHIWPGDQLIRTVQYTCHSLEALDLLNFKGVTDHLAGPAIDWLLDPPLARDLPPEDRRALRIYPSRFKTLAQLGRFDPDRLAADFADISQLLDLSTGWIRNAPYALNPPLITMIWVDTLFHLERLGLLDPTWLAQRERALQAIATAFEGWVNQAAFALAFTSASAPASLSDRLGLSRPGEIVNSGDASYAFALLIQSGKFAADAPVIAQARQLLTTAIRGRRLGEIRHTDLLYCGIQLRTYFPAETDTREVVEAFVEELRERYQNNECQREAISFHALVLRLLAAHHGERLREAILEKLWLQTRELAEAEQRLAQEQIEAAFIDLVRRSIHIHLSPAQPITGTASRGEVYRLRFSLTTEATDDRGAPFSLPRDSLRLIVKKGPPEVLVRASKRYRELPEPLQQLFARHTLDEDRREAAPGYLVMQDLADMQPLSEILDQLDRPTLRREEHEKIATAAAAVADVMATLHAYDRRATVVGHQFNVIYLTPLVNCLNRLCQPLAFPELKQWVEGTLEANGWTYKKFDWYLRRLSQFEPRLRPAGLGYLHGDCHSRNLMLNRSLTQAKFVDIETLSKAEDYVIDYGLLIEDIAVYQSLRPFREHGQLALERVQTSRPGNESSTLENWIAYPAFPERSEVALTFQRELLRRLEQYAEGIGDATWKERLWVAIARGLFLLSDRQLTSHTIEPKRRRDGLKLVQVAYAEATRLLHELIDCLEQKGKTPLPELPFPGAHRPPPRAPESQVSGLIGSLLEAFKTEFGDIADYQHAPGAPYLIDYFTRPDHRLFARLHTKNVAPTLYLACRPDQLDDPHNLAKAPGQGDLGARIPLTPATAIPDVLALVRQAYQIVVRLAAPTKQ
ncbi:MAG TPA: hypothetical protein VJG32_04955 [Anaerolineae bacterium]|nr:hypothetical protein [Anaerolineae bacterium]